MSVSSALTEVDLSNMALTMIGQQPISLLTDDNNRATMCNKRLGDVRDTVLRSHKWNAATKRATLAKTVTSPEFGFANQFQLPTLFIKMIATDLEGQAYKIEAGNESTGGDSQILLTDADTLKIVYVYQLTDVSKMDSTLKHAIACRLAADIALPLTGDLNISDMMYKKYSQILADAKFEDSSSMAAYDKLVPGEWTMGRTGALHRDFPDLNDDGSPV